MYVYVLQDYPPKKYYSIVDSAETQKLHAP